MIAPERLLRFDIVGWLQKKVCCGRWNGISVSFDVFSLVRIKLQYLFLRKLKSICETTPTLKSYKNDELDSDVL